jgi:hypothetical protein
MAQVDYQTYNIYKITGSVVMLSASRLVTVRIRFNKGNSNLLLNRVALFSVLCS